MTDRMAAAVDELLERVGHEYEIAITEEIK